MALRYRIPKRPTGSDAYSVWKQAVHDRVFKALRFITSNTVQANEGQNGIWFEALGGGGNGTTIQLCAITELYGTDSDMAFNYIGVTPWDVTANNNLGGTTGSQFFCAKCLGGRGPATEWIDSNEIVYSQYFLDNQRFAVNVTTSANEFQAIHPRYIAYPGVGPPFNPPNQFLDSTQFLIYVTRTTKPTGVMDPNGNNISFVEIQPSRNWAYSVSLNGA